MMQITVEVSMSHNPITRRHFMELIATVAAMPFLARQAVAETFEIVKTDDEWKSLLTPEQFRVMRQQGTEAPGSSPLDHNFDAGTYVCAACDLPLFSSKTKFDSHTGWPSFYQPLPNAVVTSDDHTLFISRTEVHCRRCGGHLGHVFDDGPPPTGKRYCMNGVALKFIPVA
jgi:peptide-methionine (R)-S-oxide reductase